MRLGSNGGDTPPLEQGVESEELIGRPEGRPIVILERGLEREHVGQAGWLPELAGAFDAGLELTAG